MKIILFFFLMGVSFIHAQEVFTNAILYKLTYQKDSLDKSSIINENCELLLNDSTSLFQSINYGKLDSAAQLEFKKGNNKGAPFSVINEYPTSLHVKIQKRKEETDFYEKIFAGAFLGKFKVTEPRMDDMKWTIHSETKNIGNFESQKATLDYGGRTWTAWFTMDIPISDGPYKFAGLPGLILEIEDKTGSWKYEFLGTQSNILKEVHIDSYAFFKTQPIAKKEFLKTKRYSLDNEFQVGYARGDFNGLENDVIENIKKHFKDIADKDNNWIELYP